MTGMEELLERDGRRWRADFQPPVLDPMLARATRPGAARSRWLWPIAAAVLLLAIPLATVLARSGHPGPATSKPDSRLLGPVPWVQAVGQGDGHSITVYVDVNRTPSWCLGYGLPTLQASAVETPDRIAITVRAYRPAGFRQPTAPPGTMLGCALIGHVPVPLLVRLRAAIGDRTVVDASTGKSYPVESAAVLPAPSRLPAGYADDGASAIQRGQFAERSYHNGNNQLILRRQARTVPPYFALNVVEGAGSVLGHPAQVGGAGPGGYRCVAWSDQSYGWELCSVPLRHYPSDPPALPAAELLAVANSLR